MAAPGTSPNLRRYRDPLLAGMVGICLALPLLWYDFWFDQGVFATIADTLLRGGVAYRDAWEHKPPGIFYIYAAAFALLGRDIWAVRGLEMLAIGISSAGLMHLGAVRWNSRAAGAVAAFLLPLVYLPFAPNTAQPETFQIPLLVWAMVLWPRSSSESDALRKSAGCGVLLGSAVLLKTPAAVFALAALIDRLGEDAREPGWARKTRLSGAFIAGFALLPALLLVYYSLRGALGPLWDALVVFPRRYAEAAPRRSLGSHLELSWEWLSGHLTLSEQILLGMGLVRGMLFHRGEALRLGGLLVLAWGAVALQGRYFSYHWIPLAPFLVAEMGMAVAPRPARREGASLRTVLLQGAPWGISLLVLSIVGVSDFVTRVWRPPAELGTAASIERPVPLPGVARPWGESRTVAARIRALTGPDDALFVWGDAALLYFFSHRRMAGPYPHLMPIIPEWGGRERLYDLLERLSADLPKLVAVAPGKLWWRHDDEPRKLLETFPDVHRMLVDRFRKVETVEGFELWIRIDPSN